MPRSAQMLPLLITALLLCGGGAARAQQSSSPVAQQGADADPTAADSAGIRQAALDYIEGWYTGDGDRMARALHPELAKRIISSDPASGRSRFGSMSAMTLIEGTRAGGGKRTPVAEQRKDVRILDIFRGAAVARVDA